MTGPTSSAHACLPSDLVMKRSRARTSAISRSSDDRCRSVKERFSISMYIYIYIVYV